MNDYCIGIAYATGYFANENNKNYLVVRNLDKWYPEQITAATGYSTYVLTHNIERDGREQYVVKARNIEQLPSFDRIENISEFCRAYIEIHGILDLASAKDRKGNKFTKPRLRIFGSEELITFINNVFPAENKKIQYISNKVDGKYIGRTCAIYFQSRMEIEKILSWINGEQRNEAVWNQWYSIFE